MTTKNLWEDDDAVYIVINHYRNGESMSVKDKLYASPKVASNNAYGGNIIRIDKKLLMQLHNEQNGGR